MEFLIKSCRLKPYNYYFNNSKNKIVLHRKWFDEYGNSFFLNLKDVEILFGDVQMIGKNQALSDIYEGLGILQVKKISKLCCLLELTILENKVIYVSFLGIDDYLRTFVINESVEKISSLYLGSSIIEQIYSNLDLKYFKTMKIKKSMLPMHASSARGWISFMPMHSDFKKIINDNFEQISSIFK